MCNIPALIVQGMQTIPLTPGNKIKESVPSAEGHICAAGRAHIDETSHVHCRGVVLLIHSPVDFNEHDYVAKHEGGTRGARGGLSAR